MRNLRHKLAVKIRHDVDPLNYSPPNWLVDYPGLHINPKNPLYPMVVADVLDLLKAMQWSAGRAAVLLGVSTSALTRFLWDDPALWGAVNQERILLGMLPLRHR